jgi:hypothetical protein
MDDKRGAGEARLNRARLFASAGRRRAPKPRLLQSKVVELGIV